MRSQARAKLSPRILSLAKMMKNSQKTKRFKSKPGTAADPQTTTKRKAKKVLFPKTMKIVRKYKDFSKQQTIRV
jgi:hypothetical protein